MTDKKYPDNGKKEKQKLSRRDLFKNLFNPFQEEDAPEKGSSGMDPDIIFADKLVRAQNYEQAARVYSECLEREPKHVEAMRNLGFCRYKTGELAQAKRIWENFLSYRPRDNFVLLYMGLIHAHQGDLESALSTWRSYFNTHKPVVQRQINLILAKYDRGDELDVREVHRLVEEAIEKQK